MGRRKEKPLVFVGSSSENLKTANAVQSNLQPNDAGVTVWPQGVFKAADFGLDSLLEALKTHDFGVFIFAPDDVLKIRNKEHKAVRDNVIFELGLFMGRLGRARTFVLVPNGVTLHLPTDLDGWNTVRYDPKQKNLVAAVGNACSEIREAIKAQGRFDPGSPTKEVFSAAGILEHARPFPSVLAAGMRKTRIVALGRLSHKKRLPAKSKAALRKATKKFRARP